MSQALIQINKVTNFISNSAIASYMHICILSICYVSSLSYRCMLHISTWLQATAITKELPITGYALFLQAQKDTQYSHHKIELISLHPHSLDAGNRVIFLLLWQVLFTPIAGRSQHSAQAGNSTWDSIHKSATNSIRDCVPQSHYQ